MTPNIFESAQMTMEEWQDEDERKKERDGEEEEEEEEEEEGEEEGEGGFVFYYRGSREAWEELKKREEEEKEEEKEEKEEKEEEEEEEEEGESRDCTQWLKSKDGKIAYAGAYGNSFAFFLPLSLFHSNPPPSSSLF